jgi:hypothetical protein
MGHELKRGLGPDLGRFTPETGHRRPAPNDRRRGDERGPGNVRSWLAFAPPDPGHRTRTALRASASLATSWGSAHVGNADGRHRSASSWSSPQ